MLNCQSCTLSKPHKRQDIGLMIIIQRNWVSCESDLSVCSITPPVQLLPTDLAAAREASHAATMEQLLSINGLSWPAALCVCAPFSLPFIFLRFLSLGFNDEFKTRRQRQKRSNSIFSKNVFLLKIFRRWRNSSHSITKCFFLQAINEIILLTHSVYRLLFCTDQNIFFKSIVQTSDKITLGVLQKCCLQPASLKPQRGLH